VLMNGNGQYLRDGSLERGITNGDRREERDASAAGYELREGSRGGQLPLLSPYPTAARLRSV
jgi:hypothetical protein